MKYKKIALMGVAGSGKDWVYSNLIKKHPDLVRLSFSDHLKKIAHNTFDWLKRDYPPELKEKPLNIVTSLGERIELTPREIWLKMNFLREIENGLFVRKVKDDLDDLEFCGVENFIITDLRTKPELDFVKKEGFKIIRILNSNNFHLENDFDKIQNSEEFLKAIDHTYYNAIGKAFDENEFFDF